MKHISETIPSAETKAAVQGQPLIVGVTPYEVILRQKGRRYAFAVPYEAIWDLGAKLAALEARESGRKR